VITADGSLLLCDENNYTFWFPNSRQKFDFPIINNVFSTDNKLIERRIDGAIKIIKALQETNFSFQLLVSEIIFRNGSYFLFFTDSDIEINLGTASNLSEKLFNVWVFWTEVLSRKQASERKKYTNIDARFSNRVLIK
jgi:hypothetical protein